MKIACLYLTHINTKCIFNLQTLVKHISSYKDYQIDLYIYVNNEQLKDIIYNGNYCEFTYANLQEKLNYVHLFDEKIPHIGNCCLPLIDLYLNYQEYDKFIFYEDDVSYIGNINMFNLFNFNSDIIFQSKRNLDTCWFWYTYKLGGDKFLHNLSLRPYNGLLNIYMLSKEVIQKVYEFMLNGNYAHYEYLINSYIMENYEKYGWKINYLEGNNEFTVYSNDLKYTSKNFIHPIKDIKKLNEYKQKAAN